MKGTYYSTCRYCFICLLRFLASCWVDGYLLLTWHMQGEFAGPTIVQVHHRFLRDYRAALQGGVFPGNRPTTQKLKTGLSMGSWDLEAGFTCLAHVAQFRTDYLIFENWNHTFFSGGPHFKWNLIIAFWKFSCRVEFKQTEILLGIPSTSTAYCFSVELGPFTNFPVHTYCNQSIISGSYFSLGRYLQVSIYWMYLWKAFGSRLKK